VTAIIDSPNTVPNNDAMMSIVMNPPMSETESILDGIQKFLDSLFSSLLIAKIS
jgi:hypothetical protein